MKFNNLGLNLLKTFEGCKLTAYKDIKGVLTIGFGHTGSDVIENLTITQKQADDLLINNLLQFEKEVSNLLKIQLNDNQYSAVICFVYNVGGSAFKRSNLLKLINKGEFVKAADAFLPWDIASGIVIPGLSRRRQAERSLFLLPV